MTTQSGKIEILVRFGTHRLRFKGEALDGHRFRQKLESDTSEFVAQISDYFASRGVAFPDGVEFTFPDGSRKKFSRTKAAPLTKRQKEILHESGRLIFLDSLKSIAKSEDESADIEKAKKVYEKLVFGRGGPSEKKRAASEFLRRWDNARLYDDESLKSEAISLPMRMIYLTPLLNALDAHDAEFVEALTEDMKMSQSERDKVRKRLIEVDELVHPTGPIPTWRAIWRKHCPDHEDSPQNFQKLLRECGIPFESVGEFRGNGRKRVRRRKKNTHRARCKVAAIPFTAADVREVQARARRSALVDTRADKGS
jgi:hypothetical protein